MIRPPFLIRAFTLAEMVIAMGASTIILAALVLSSTQLQRALYASEHYANAQSSQRRLADYVSRDLRRAIGIATTTTVNGTGGTSLYGAAATIEDTTSLMLTLPAYYQSDDTTADNYDASLPVVSADNRIDYGTSEGHAPAVQVIFRKTLIESEHSMCFVRIEGGHQTVIVRDADVLHLQVSISGDGRLGAINVSSIPGGGIAATKTSTREKILLRNLRNDQ